MVPVIATATGLGRSCLLESLHLRDDRLRLFLLSEWSGRFGLCALIRISSKTSRARTCWETCLFPAGWHCATRSVCLCSVAPTCARKCVGLGHRTSCTFLVIPEACQYGGAWDLPQYGCQGCAHERVALPLVNAKVGVHDGATTTWLLDARNEAIGEPRALRQCLLIAVCTSPPTRQKEAHPPASRLGPQQRSPPEFAFSRISSAAA